MSEGICNHFSALAPGYPELFLVNLYGLAFEEITASKLLTCDFHGNVVDGAGEPEATAFYIHGRRTDRTGLSALFQTAPHLATISALASAPLMPNGSLQAFNYWPRHFMPCK
ncbi:class II aldolase/adducin family protein [Vreelandella populi]|uniref:class II aldolase/adducin family protein n=2 Tax=Halomonadaceae TaxID=28256 RepID=UPI001C258D67|nr:MULTISPECIES: class II aldolase/adducin family protein [Halomonas]